MLIDDSAHCPYKIMDNYIENRQGYNNESEPFFVFSDGSEVKPTHVRDVLRKALTLIGLDCHLYDIHSFHIRQATDLIKMGFSIEHIKLVGRWRSNAVFKYIHKRNINPKYIK